MTGGHSQGDESPRTSTLNGHEMTCQVIHPAGCCSWRSLERRPRTPAAAGPPCGGEPGDWLGPEYLIGLCGGCRLCSAGGSSSAAGGMAAMESSENMRRPSSCQCSSCSSSTAPPAARCRIVREDADHLGAPLDLFVDALQQVGAPQLAPVAGWEVAERQDVLAGRGHQFGRPVGTWRRAWRSPGPTAPPRRCGSAGEHRAQGGGHHLLLCPGHRLQQVAGKVHSRHRCQEQPWHMRPTALVSPTWASETTRRTPVSSDIEN